MQDGVFLLGRAAEAAAAGCRAPGIRVSAFKELSHEAKASLADVGAASEHVEDGVDSAAEVGKGNDVGTSHEGGTDHLLLVLQQACHLVHQKKKDECVAVGHPITIPKIEWGCPFTQMVSL